MKGFWPQNNLWGKKITLVPLAVLSNRNQDLSAKDRVAMSRGKRKKITRTSWSYWKLSWINLQFDNLDPGAPPVRFKFPHFFLVKASGKQVPYSSLCWCFLWYSTRTVNIRSFFDPRFTHFISSLLFFFPPIEFSFSPCCSRISPC